MQNVMKCEFIHCMNFHSSIQNVIYENLHYCRTRWTQNNKNLCIECVVNLVHILRLFPHHPRDKSHWRIVFLAATAAQEAHLSLRVYPSCVLATFGNVWQLFATVPDYGRLGSLILEVGQGLALHLVKCWSYLKSLDHWCYNQMGSDVNCSSDRHTG